MRIWSSCINIFINFLKEHENEYKKRFESPSAEILELKIRPYRHNELYNLYYIPTSEILNLVYTIEKTTRIW